MIHCLIEKAEFKRGIVREKFINKLDIYIRVRFDESYTEEDIKTIYYWEILIGYKNNILLRNNNRIYKQYIIEK